MPRHMGRDTPITMLRWRMKAVGMNPYRYEQLSARGTIPLEEGLQELARREAGARSKAPRKRPRSSSDQQIAQAQSEAPIPVPPFPKVDRALAKGINALNEGRFSDALEQFEYVLSKRSDSDYTRFAAAMAAYQLDDLARTRDLLRPLTQNPSDVLNDPLWDRSRALRKSQPGLALPFDPPLPIPLDPIGASAFLIFSYLDDVPQGLEVFLSLPSEITQHSLLLYMKSELLLVDEQWEQLARIQVPNVPEDDVTAQTLLWKAVALREVGLSEAALDGLKTILRRKTLDPTVLRCTRYHRALTYEALGKTSMARRDFEIVWAEAPDFEDVSERLGLSSKSHR